MLFALRCTRGGFVVMYIDEILCTGCGICLEACVQGAISLRDCRAVIDPYLCVECGRCAELCLTRAIGQVEVLEATPPCAAPGLDIVCPFPRPGASPLSPAPAQGVVSPATTNGTVGGPDTGTLAKVFAGAVGLLDFALDQKAGGRPGEFCRGAGGTRRHHKNRCRAGR